MDHGFDATTSALGIGPIGLVVIPSTLVLLAACRPPAAAQAAGRHLLRARGVGFFSPLLAGSTLELYGTSVIGGIAWPAAQAVVILADRLRVRLVGVLYRLTYTWAPGGAMISSRLGGWGYEHWHAPARLHPSRC